MAIITKTTVYVANAGDTRCVMAIKGKAKDLSVDHKPDMASEKRRITKAGGFVEDGRVNGIIAVSRAIGDWEYKSPSLKAEDMMVTAYPEVKVEKLTPDHDFIIIACDGIWDCLSSQQAVDHIYTVMKSKSNSPKRGAAGNGTSPKKQESPTVKSPSKRNQS